jgi:hypothetical protein
LTFALLAAAASALMAAFALFRAVRTGRRADRLAESYWELRYEIGQLKVRLQRLETAAGVADATDAESEVAAPRPAATTTFVPLSSLKK